ncbi:MAG TPA: hypothetical protein VH025_00645 [Solirubrobacteraceae bacterium]|nr:hypothetical protein [Solirubrobacteraceae bacterium]
MTGSRHPKEPTLSGPTIDELMIADDADAWRALGFTVEDDCCRLGRVLLRFVADGEERGILRWSLRGLQATMLDGLPTSLSETELPEPAAAHANGAIAIDHVVAFSPAFERSVQALRDAGLDLRRVRDEPTPTGAPRQAFFRLGDEILELVQEPEEAVSRLGGPDHPARFWGLAVIVEDIDRAAAEMAPHTSDPRPAVQPGRRIATVRRSAGLTVPLALMSGVENGNGASD